MKKDSWCGFRITNAIRYAGWMDIFCENNVTICLQYTGSNNAPDR